MAYLESHRIVFIAKAFLTPYFVINLTIGKHTPFVCHKQSQYYMCLYIKADFMAIVVYFSLAGINFKVLQTNLLAQFSSASVQNLSIG